MFTEEFHCKIVTTYEEATLPFIFSAHAFHLMFLYFYTQCINVRDREF